MMDKIITMVMQYLDCSEKDAKVALDTIVGKHDIIDYAVRQALISEFGEIKNL